MFVDETTISKTDKINVSCQSLCRFKFVLQQLLCSPCLYYTWQKASYHYKLPYACPKNLITCGGNLLAHELFRIQGCLSIKNHSNRRSFSLVHLYVQYLKYYLNSKLHLGLGLYYACSVSTRQ